MGLKELSAIVGGDSAAHPVPVLSAAGKTGAGGRQATGGTGLPRGCGRPCQCCCPAEMLAVTLRTWRDQSLVTRASHKDGPAGRT